MSLFGKVVRGGISALRTVTKIPGASNVLKAIPVVGTVAAVGSAGYDIYKAATAGGGLPALPGMPAGMPALPGTGVMGPATKMGERGLFQNDPNIVAALQPWAISKTNLRQSFRAPKGFVIRYDSNGDAFGIPKPLAKAYLGWKPSKKPPISVGDWEAVKRADRTVKKVKKVMTTMTRVDKAVGKGGKVKVKSHK